MRHLDSALRPNSGGKDLARIRPFQRTCAERASNYSLQRHDYRSTCQIYR